MKNLFVSFIYVSVILIYGQDRPWENMSLSIEQRSAALVEALTLEEKVAMMTDQSAAVERLGIPEYNWWNESLHGVARNGRATVFPQAIGMAATFDDELVKRIATAISDEARAKFNVALSLGNRGRYAGLTFWTPNINIFRDPRWGRGQETYGEDPYLTSRIGVAFVQGIQGDNDKYLKAAACAKHYAVHSGPEALRHEFDAVATPKDMFETYLPAFEALVTEAKVEGIMGAYNRVNGDPACASPFLLQEMLKEKWGFNGYIVSDCSALGDFHQNHKVTKTPEESAALALNNGVNVNCGWVYPYLDKAIEQGLTTEAQLDKVLTQQLLTRFRLGFFDIKGSNPFENIPESVVNSEKHIQLAREAARKSVVLLKNKNNILPLRKDVKYMYVVGPHASSEEVLLGNYYGLTSNTQTILDGITSKVSLGTSVFYKQGIMPYQKNINTLDWTTGEAASADVTIAVMGISSLYEGEEGDAIASASRGDRDDIRLPEHQVQLIKTIKEKNADSRIVLVLTGGAPIALPELYDLVEAIVFVWYPGEQGGNGVADVLFGDAPVSGKLPITFPKSVDQLPPYEDYSMRGRTYKYMTEEPQFPFGFGLSYADIELSAPQASPQKDKVIVQATVTNKSDIPTEEVVQIYLKSPRSGEEDPIFDLKGFKRIELKAKETKNVEFILDCNSFMSINQKGEKELYKGEYSLIIGTSLPIKRSQDLGAPPFVETTITSKKIPKK